MRKLWMFAVMLGLMVHGILLFQPVHQDEAHFITIARDVAAGRPPYTTLFDNKPPGIYLLLAPLTYVFGDSIVGYRAVYLGLTIGLWLIMWVLMRHENTRGGDDLFWQIGGLTLGLSGLFHGNYALTELPSLLMGLFGMYWLRRTPHIDVRQVLMAGGLVGLSFWFKQTGLVFIPMGLAMLRHQRAAWNRYGGYVAGVSLSLFGLMGYGLAAGIPELLWQALVGVNLAHYPAAVRSDIATFGLVQIGLPLAGLWLAGCFGMRQVFQKEKTEAQLWGLYVLYILPWLLYRPYHHYWVYVMPAIIFFIIHVKSRLLQTIVWLHIVLVLGGFGYYSLTTGLTQAAEQQAIYRTRTECNRTDSLDWYFGHCP